jgi:preprotein translocase subunit SecD
MQPNILSGALLAMFAFGTLSACSTTQKSPDLTNQIRNALDQAGLKDVNVKQDRDKGVVTLTGTTASDADKSQAESKLAANGFHDTSPELRSQLLQFYSEPAGPDDSRLKKKDREKLESEVQQLKAATATAANTQGAIVPRRENSAQF